MQIRTMRFSILLIVGFLVLPATGARADILNFSSPDFIWSHPSGGASPNHIWITGDFWEQTFSGTSLGAASLLSVNIFVDDNILTAGNHVDLDVLLNSTSVGIFSIASGSTGLISNTFLFSPIAAAAGNAFDIKILETNTIPEGEGSVSMGILEQQSWAKLLLEGEPVPEPTSFLLLGTGLGVLCLVAWRRRK